MFELTFVIFLLLVIATLKIAGKRSVGLSLLVVLTFGNAVYGMLTPVIAHYLPVAAVIFTSYLESAGTFLSPDGLLRIARTVVIFQLALLLVAALFRVSVPAMPNRDSPQSAGVVAIIGVGGLLISLGISGLALTGVSFNGSIVGLFDMEYSQRTPFLRRNSLLAFLMFAGLLGAAQIISCMLYLRKPIYGGLVLLILAFYGVAVGSKFPIFWGTVIFVYSALVARVSFRAIAFPAFLASIALLSLSGLRSGLTISEALFRGGFQFWNNDVPGPSSITYFVLNGSNIEFTLEPLLAIPKLLIPSFIMTRGSLMPDVWAEKMIGSSYEIGLGFGWSVLIDGYLLFGLTGVFVVGLLLARIATGLDFFVATRAHSVVGHVFASSVAPVFFAAFRDSVAGSIKTGVMIAVFVWVPTLVTKKCLSRWYSANVVRVRGGA